MLPRIALVLVSSLGWAISLYFTLVRYQVIAPEQRFIPRFCRLESGNCRTILRSPVASILGIPNSLLGVAYYLVILFLSINEWIEVPPAFVKWVFITSLVASAVGISLAFSLLRDLKTPCVLCFVSHGINIFISILLYVNL